MYGEVEIYLHTFLAYVLTKVDWSRVLDSQGHNSRCPLVRNLRGPQRQSAYTPQRVEPRFLRWLVSMLITIPAQPTQLLVPMCRSNFFLMAQQSLVGQGLLIIEASLSHSDTPHSVGLSGRVVSPTEKPLPDNTQHSQQTSMPPGGIRTRKPSKREAADQRLRLRGHWDRQCVTLFILKRE